MGKRMMQARRVDEHVGERIRRRRSELGLTQEQLAESLGISYQQVQKYETGANRISAGRLYRIARRLESDIGFFFEDIDDAGAKSEDRAAQPAAGNQLSAGAGRNRLTIEAARNFAAISDPAVRSALSNMIRALADESRRQQQAA
jgi:transcriptional regulator with XRE-family HTH domain